jgi:GTP-binding protein
VEPWRQARFEISAAEPRGFHVADGTEIALVGRSNAGKSSALNALCGQRALARTSRTPGRTQMVNFFRIDDGRRLVDLPGYGYAKESKSKVAAWTSLVKNYLRGRVTLRRICLLIDGRHGLKPNDIEIMDMLDKAAVPYQIVLTKMDKVKKADQAALEEAKADGSITVHDWSAEERAKFRESAGEPVWQKWVEDMEQRGLPGQEVLDFVLEQAEEHAGS